MRSAPEPLLTPGEVASILRISRATVSRWSKTGPLKPVRVGSAVRYRREDIEDLLEAS